VQESRSAFDEAVALEPLGAGRFRGRTHPGYANFVGPFGGTTAAQCLAAVLAHPERIGDPVALTVNYAAAVADGEFEVLARPARTNRSTQHWFVELLQGGQTVITATALTAVRRETFAATEAPVPDVPRPGDVPRAAERPRVEWVNRYELRFIDAGLPSEWNGEDAGQSRTRLWARDDPPRPLDFLSLTAMSDIFFPRIWRRRALFVPLGTISMTVYFHAGEAQLKETATGHLLGQAQGQGFRAGYFDQTAQLWNEAGVLLATTHQVVYFKE